MFVITLSRAAEYNTITPALRDDLAQALDEADANRGAHVILLRAEGPAFCAGYGLDWAVTAQTAESDAPDTHAAGSGAARVWDSVDDADEFVAAYRVAAERRNESRAWPAAVVERGADRAAVAVVEGAPAGVAAKCADALLAAAPEPNGPDR